jgi:hypothetical protein
MTRIPVNSAIKENIGDNWWLLSPILKHLTRPGCSIHMGVLWTSMYHLLNKICLQNMCKLLYRVNLNTDSYYLPIFLWYLYFALYQVWYFFIHNYHFRHSAFHLQQILKQTKWVKMIHFKYFWFQTVELMSKYYSDTMQNKDTTKKLANMLRIASVLFSLFSQLHVKLPWIFDSKCMDQELYNL